MFYGSDWSRFWLENRLLLVLAEKHLAFLLGVLNSKVIRFYITQVFGGNSLQGGYLRIGPPQLRQLPMPTLSSLSFNPSLPLSAACLFS